MGKNGSETANVSDEHDWEASLCECESLEELLDPRGGNIGGGSATCGSGIDARVCTDPLAVRAPHVAPAVLATWDAVQRYRDSCETVWESSKVLSGMLGTVLALLDGCAVHIDTFVEQQAQYAVRIRTADCATAAISAVTQFRDLFSLLEQDVKLLMTGTDVALATWMRIGSCNSAKDDGHAHRGGGGGNVPSKYDGPDGTVNVHVDNARSTAYKRAKWVLVSSEQLGMNNPAVHASVLQARIDDLLRGWVTLRGVVSVVERYEDRTARLAKELVVDLSTLDEEYVKLFDAFVTWAESYIRSCHQIASDQLADAVRDYERVQEHGKLHERLAQSAAQADGTHADVKTGKRVRDDGSAVDDESSAGVVAPDAPIMTARVQAAVAAAGPYVRMFTTWLHVMTANTQTTAPGLDSSGATGNSDAVACLRRQTMASGYVDPMIAEIVVHVEQSCRDAFIGIVSDYATRRAAFLGTKHADYLRSQIQRANGRFVGRTFAKVMAQCCSYSVVVMNQEWKLLREVGGDYVGTVLATPDDEGTAASGVVGKAWSGLWDAVREVVSSIMSGCVDCILEMVNYQSGEFLSLCIRALHDGVFVSARKRLDIVLVPVVMPHFQELLRALQSSLEFVCRAELDTWEQSWRMSGKEPFLQYPGLLRSVDGVTDTSSQAGASDDSGRDVVSLLPEDYGELFPSVEFVMFFMRDSYSSLEAAAFISVAAEALSVCIEQIRQAHDHVVVHAESYLAAHATAYSPVASAHGDLFEMRQLLTLQKVLKSFNANMSVTHRRLTAAGIKNAAVALWSRALDVRGLWGLATHVARDPLAALEGLVTCEFPDLYKSVVLDIPRILEDRLTTCAAHIAAACQPEADMFAAKVARYMNDPETLLSRLRHGVDGLLEQTLGSLLYTVKMYMWKACVRLVAVASVWDVFVKKVRITGAKACDGQGLAAAMLGEVLVVCRDGVMRALDVTGCDDAIVSRILPVEPQHVTE